jgi:Saxitoxin biosynthesis operon protein SxtJ
MSNSSPHFHEDLAREHERRLSSDRMFGLVVSGAFVTVGVLPALHGKPTRLWAITIGVAFLMLALAVPRVLHRANVYWSNLGLLLNRIVSPVVMALLFFVVVTPVALIFRILGNDPLHLKLDPAATTYWIDRVPPGPSPESIRDQF